LVDFVALFQNLNVKLSLVRVLTRNVTHAETFFQQELPPQHFVRRHLELNDLRFENLFLETAPLLAAVLH
jgi:hypothetical protein